MNRSVKNSSRETIQLTIRIITKEDNGHNELQFNRPITFFLGENGSGKSTLLEAIAVQYGFNPEGGTKNYSFSTYNYVLLSEEDVENEINSETII